MHDRLTHPAASAAAPLPDTVLPLGAAPFIAWAINALPGDRAIYWQGHIARDAWPVMGRLRPRDCRALTETARLALRLAEDGYLRLVQHRLGTHDYAYVAIVRRMSPARRARRLTLPLAEAA